MLRFLAAFSAILYIVTPALACSPPLDTRSLIEKAAVLPALFVVKVLETGDAYTVLQILSSRDPSLIGTEIRKPHEAYGTCGELKFHPDEVWLYDSDMPLSLSRRLTPEDLGNDNGRNIDELVARLQDRDSHPQE